MRSTCQSTAPTESSSSSLPPADLAIPSNEVEAWLEAAVSEAAAQGIRGGSVTPFVLGRLGELSEGRTLRTNIGLIVNNARMAARIAVALAQPRTSTA